MSIGVAEFLVSHIETSHDQFEGERLGRSVFRTA
jgi:hypothetical protein